jgi:hypothetical protein
MPCSTIYSKKDYKQKQNNSKATKWAHFNERTLNQGGKIENLKKEMKVNAVSVLDVSK